MSKRLSIRIKQAREQEHLTQAELAHKFGVVPQTIFNWENGVCEPRGEPRDNLFHWLKKVERDSDASEEADSDDSAEALCLLRKIHKHWPQSRIAEALRVSQGTVSNWLRTGKVSDGYLEALQRIDLQLAKADDDDDDDDEDTDDDDSGETTYGDWLNGEIENQGMLPPDLAEKSGVTLHTILALLDGTTQKPQQRTRERIEEALQTTGEPSPEDDDWCYVGIEWKREQIEEAPTDPGVYVIHDQLLRPLYVGVAHRGKGGIKGRLRSHWEKKWTEVARWFSYALSDQLPKDDSSQFAKSLEKLLIKFMGNTLPINKNGLQGQRNLIR